MAGSLLNGTRSMYPYQRIVMMPDSPKNQHSLPRSQVVEVIMQGQEEILRQLRAEGITETEALAVIKRFSTFSVQVLRELDDLYRQFSELLANDPERGAAHQEWLETKTGGVLLMLESFISELIAEALKKAKENYRTTISQPRDVIIPTPPRPSVWEQALYVLGRQLRDPLVRWSVGYSAWFLVWFFAIGTPIAGFIAISITAVVVYFFEKAGLLMILIAGGMFLCVSFRIPSTRQAAIRSSDRCEQT
jgi:hypothetical protein